MLVVKYVCLAAGACVFQRVASAARFFSFANRRWFFRNKKSVHRINEEVFCVKRVLITLLVLLLLLCACSGGNADGIVDSYGEVKTTVYRTKHGEKYHRKGCYYLEKSKIETTLVKAESMGLTPCSVCW